MTKTTTQTTKMYVKTFTNKWHCINYARKMRANCKSLGWNFTCLDAEYHGWTFQYCFIINK